MADDKGVADEAKSFSQDLVATLGLVELILGGVGLYGLWLILKDNAPASLFPSTGSAFVDVGLQLFAAALVGKVIYLIVAFPIGVIRGQLKRNNKYYDPLRNALGAFYGNDLSSVERSDTNLLDPAIEYLSTADTKQRVIFERHRVRIIVSYGTSFLALIFLVHFFCNKYQETPTGLFVLLAITFIVFIFVGYVKQCSLFSDATDALVSLYQVEERKKELNQKKD